MHQYLTDHGYLALLVCNLDLVVAICLATLLTPIVSIFLLYRAARKTELTNDNRRIFRNVTIVIAVVRTLAVLVTIVAIFAITIGFNTKPEDMGLITIAQLIFGVFAVVSAHAAFKTIGRFRREVFMLLGIPRTYPPSWMWLPRLSPPVWVPLQPSDKEIPPTDPRR